MGSKLGFHVDVVWDDAKVAAMIEARPAVVKSVHEITPLHQLRNALGEQIVLVYRNFKNLGEQTRVMGDAYQDFPRSGDAALDVRRWWEWQVPYLHFLPLGTYIESFNEMDNWSLLSSYAQFEAERAYFLAERGLKSCLGNFAVGAPDITNPHLLRQLDPMLKAAHDTGSLIGLHEYGAGWLDMYVADNVPGRRIPFPEHYIEGWHFLRYRKLWNYIQSKGWTNARIVLTEFGMMNPCTDWELNNWLAFNGYPSVGAWRRCAAMWAQVDGRADTAQYYFEMLQWADRQMQKDAYCVGATIWLWGHTGRWAEDEIYPEVSSKVLDHIKANAVEMVRTLSTKGQHIRANKSIGSRVIGRATEQDRMTVISGRENIGRDAWVEVQLRGVRGWILGSYLVFA